MITANRKQRFQVRHLVLDSCDLYLFSYNSKKVIISLEAAAILNFQTAAVFDFQMATRSLIFTHGLKITSKHVYTWKTGLLNFILNMWCKQKFRMKKTWKPTAQHWKLALRTPNVTAVPTHVSSISLLCGAFTENLGAKCHYCAISFTCVHNPSSLDYICPTMSVNCSTFFLKPIEF